MLLLIVGIIIALAVGSFLLALVCDAFADALSGSVEATFDFVEYKMALRSAGRRVNQTRIKGISSYATTLQRAA